MLRECSTIARTSFRQALMSAAFFYPFRRVPGEFQQVGHDPFADLGLFLNGLQGVEHLGLPGEILCQQLGVAQDDAQRRVDFMGHTGG